MMTCHGIRFVSLLAVFLCFANCSDEIAQPDAMPDSCCTIDISFSETIGDQMSPDVNPSEGGQTDLSDDQQIDVGKTDTINPLIAQILVVGAPATIAAGTGSTPIMAIALDASYKPLSGVSFSYQVDKPTVASFDPSTGVLKGGILTNPKIGEPVTITASSGGKSGSAKVVVVPVTQAQVTVSAMPGTSFGVYDLASSMAGVPNAQIEYGPPTGVPTTTNTQGLFSSFPDVPPGTLVTWKASKTGYLDGYFSMMSPMLNYNMMPYGGFVVYKNSVLSKPICGIAQSPQKTVVMVLNGPTQIRDGWTYYFSGNGTNIFYLNNTAADCTANATTKGGAVILNVEAGYYWLLAQKSATVHARIIHVPAAPSIVAFGWYIN
ncbi:MAG: hypothetical protein V1754_02770 [Pseudomonadota bacterium]